MLTDARQQIIIGRPATPQLFVRRNRYLQEHLYATMFTSGEVRVERQGPPEVTEALVEALRLQWSYGFPFSPSVSFTLCWRLQVSKRA